MKSKSGTFRQEAFAQALQGKKIPILTLDNKWYRLLDDDTRRSVKGLEDQLNSLLKRQGKETEKETDERDRPAGG